MMAVIAAPVTEYNQHVWNTSAVVELKRVISSGCQCKAFYLNARYYCRRFTYLERQATIIKLYSTAKAVSVCVQTTLKMY